MIVQIRPSPEQLKLIEWAKRHTQNKAANRAIMQALQMYRDSVIEAEYKAIQERNNA